MGDTVAVVVGVAVELAFEAVNVLLLLLDSLLYLGLEHIKLVAIRL